MENRLRLCCILTVAAGMTFAARASAKESMRVAVETKDLARVQMLLSQDPSLANAKDTMGRAPLQLAASERGDPVEIARLLISYGADVNAKDGHGRTPLHWACMAGNFAVAKLLISRGVTVNATASNGSTPLDMALLFNHSRTGRLLVAEGARESIFNASALGDMDRIEDLLAGNPALAQAKEKELTPLLWAAMRRQRSAVRLLLNYMPNLSIFAASASGDGSRVEELLRENPKLLNAWGPMGLTPLHWAVLAGQYQTAEMLIERGANVNAKAQDDGRTPLFVAAAVGDQEMVRLLLTHDADPSSRTAYGLTPYAIAQAMGHRVVAQMIGYPGSKE